MSFVRYPPKAVIVVMMLPVLVGIALVYSNFYDVLTINAENNKSNEEQAVTITSPTMNSSLSIEETDFLPPSESDVYAGSWWQSVPRFLEVDITAIGNLEGNSFAAIYSAGRSISDAQMTRDYLDFAVEHLSKWWRMGGEPAMALAIGKLQSYIQRTLQKTSSSVMNSTLAILPFHVSVKRGAVDKQMEATSLAATMALLLQHGVGRIVAVGYNQEDFKYAQIVFRQLLRYGQDEHNMTMTASLMHPSHTEHNINGTTEASAVCPPFSVIFGSTELAFIHMTDMNSTNAGKNVPRGALKGLQTALLNGTSSTVWFGETPSLFKYIYFTEPDQILNARLTPLFTREMDQGKIMIPHRLQPIPHPLDLAGIVEERLMLPANQFSKVFQLEATTDSCCDTGECLTRSIDGCGSFWWQCGFNTRNFSHLEGYNLMTLSEGTGIVSLAATEHSRRCHPLKNQQKCR
jgi:hypothetical protein